MKEKKMDAIKTLRQDYDEYVQTIKDAKHKIGPPQSFEEWIGQVGQDDRKIRLQLEIDLRRKTAALEALKIRLHFVGRTNEPHWTPSPETIPQYSIPDWRKEIAMLEAALHGCPHHGGCLLEIGYDDCCCLHGTCD